MTLLCISNLPGNYQNPFNCNQFIMCISGGLPYLWQCPGYGVYVPGADLCGYPGGFDTCPWKSMWSGDVDCQTLGQSPFWSSLTIPTDPAIRCGSRIQYCSHNAKISDAYCPQNWGYSKVYNGCLPYYMCVALDRYFNL